jgi:hypothetical protein
MNRECSAFRRELQRSLENHVHRGSAPLRDLLWHRHLHECRDCRELLSAEEALEALLSSLPNPSLPLGLAQRVLARLSRPAGAPAGLDDLLELDRPESCRPGLAGRVLAHLAEERALARRNPQPARDLDELLEHARPVEMPAGLAERVKSRVRASTGTRGVLLRWRWAAAAALLALLLGVYALYPRNPQPAPMVAMQDPPDPGLLENLLLLEEWDLLQGGDLEVLLSTLPAEDEYLLDLGAEGAAEQGGQPKKG